MCALIVHHQPISAVGCFLFFDFSFFFVEPDAVQSFANALFISARHFMEYEIVEALNEFVCTVCLYGYDWNI